MSTPNIEPLLTSREAAAILRKKQESLAKERWRGYGVPFVKCGTRVFYEASAIRAFLAARTRRSTSDPGPTGTAA